MTSPLGQAPAWDAGRPARHEEDARGTDEQRGVRPHVRLTRKALRLYDELGLLTPARVDPQSGYRLYAPAQLEQARLVAWLRRLGMPLARIRAMSALPPAEAAAELARYWERVEAETAARRELASFLIGYLSGRDAAMAAPTESSPSATRCGPTSAWTGGQRGRRLRGGPLLAVADGLGGHAAGEVASAAVTRPCGRWTLRCHPVNC